MSAASPLILSTACLTPWPLPAVARAAAAAGYDGLELVLGIDHLLHGAAWVRRAARGSPVPVFSVHQPLFGVGPWRSLTRAVSDTVELALQLGAGVVVLHAPRVRSWDDARGREWLAALDQAQQRVTGSATRLTVENLGAHARRPTPTALGALDDLAAFCRQHGLGLTYDTCHAGTLGADLTADLAAVSDVLANVHLSDYRPSAPLERLPVLDMAFANHQMPGEGALDLGQALHSLAAQGYHGPITFEISPFALRAWLPTWRRARLARALAFAREALAATAASSTAVRRSPTGALAE
jgi:sugar phosphate isomerase/epimerase